MHITDFQNNRYTCDCLGCAIGAGEVSPPGGLICESEHFVVHQDPEVPVRGFLIIASKRHPVDCPDERDRGGGAVFAGVPGQAGPGAVGAAPRGSHHPGGTLGAFSPVVTAVGSLEGREVRQFAG